MQTGKSLFLKSKLSAITVGIVLSCGTLAQEQESADSESDEATLEKITVTAQRRVQSLQETPIAISAFTAKDIETRGYDDISQIAVATLSLTFDTTAAISGSSSAAVVFLRGVGSPSFQVTDDPGVGTYIDGVYVSSSIGGVLDVIDVERIEVLRGPQGTLFGRNTIGGAINVTSAKPSGDEGGSLSITLGNFDRTNVRGSFDFALSDELFVKVSAGSKRADGFIEHLIAPSSIPSESTTTDDTQRTRSIDDLGDDNESAARVAIVYQPTEDLEIYVTADASRVRETSAASSLVGTFVIPPEAGGPNLAFLYNTVQAPNTQVPGFGDQVILFGDQFIAPDPSRQTFATGPNGTSVDVWGVSTAISYDISDSLEFKSITAYRRTDAEFNRDADGSPLTITHGSNDFFHEQYSQELQLGGYREDWGLNWVAGVYYFKEEATDNFRAPIVTDFFGVGILNSEVENTSFAAFGQGTYEITDKLDVTFGIRFTEDDKELLPDYRTEEGTGGPFLAFDPVTGEQLPNVPNELVSDTFSEVTSKLSFEYQVHDDLLTYLSYSEGFKSGGFNGRQPFFRAEGVIQFEPETLATVEFGTKWQSSNDRYRVNAAAFFTEYDDVQLTVFEGIAPGTQNGGDAEIKGLEVEGTLIFSDNFRLRPTLAYLDGEYVRLEDGVQFGIDSELANTPEFTASVNAEYYLPFWNGKGDLIFSFDLAYTSEVFNNEQNDEALRQGGNTLIDARLIYQPHNSDWKAIFWGKNLSDKRLITSGDVNIPIGFAEANFNRPREFGVTLSRSF